MSPALIDAPVCFRAALGLVLILGPAAFALSSTTQTAAKETPPMKHASGTFEVKLTPQPPDPAAGEPVLGRMVLDKVFKGDLEGRSRGEMLAIGTEVKDSAGYVAMERVTGVLDGRAGSFALQHSGTMTRGVPELSVTVIPDSGTGELAGISGRMTIDVSGGRHVYTFDYTIPQS